MIKKSCNIGKRVLLYYKDIYSLEEYHKRRLTFKKEELGKRMCSHSKNILENEIINIENQIIDIYILRETFENLIIECVKKEHKDKFEEIKKEVIKRLDVFGCW